MRPFRTRLAVAAARLTATASRVSGSGGTSLPVKVLLRADPRAIRRLASELRHGSAIISATNASSLSKMLP